MLFDIFYHNCHVWMEVALQINFFAVFPILANFAAFLDNTKENADKSKMMANFTLIFMFSKSKYVSL